MLQYNEIKPRKYIVFKDEPFEVQDSLVFRKQQRKPVNQTKLKSLLSGKVIEYSFAQSDKVEEANMGSFKAVYTFSKYNRDSGSDEFWFHREDDRSERFSLATDIISDYKNFIKRGAVVEALTFEDKVIGLSLPQKMTFAVTEAPPNIKGNTAQGGDKKVTIETGAQVTTPMFINVGDKIIVNTDTGQYDSRA